MSLAKRRQVAGGERRGREINPEKKTGAKGGARMNPEQKTEAKGGGGEGRTRKQAKMWKNT